MFPFRLAVPCGQLQVTLTSEALVALAWCVPPGIPVAAPSLPLARRVVRALRRYFDTDPAAPFDLPLAAVGTPFQRRVWAALCAIPAGQVRTYGALAAALGTSPRAVAAACRANPWPVVVPCHRVVAAAGPGGYCGATAGPRLAIKRWLLCHEGAHA